MISLCETSQLYWRKTFLARKSLLVLPPDMPAMCALVKPGRSLVCAACLLHPPESLGMLAFRALLRCLRKDFHCGFLVNNDDVRAFFFGMGRDVESRFLFYQLALAAPPANQYCRFPPFLGHHEPFAFFAEFRHKITILRV